jgi:hypothetical protein
LGKVRETTCYEHRSETRKEERWNRKDVRSRDEDVTQRRIRRRFARHRVGGPPVPVGPLQRQSRTVPLSVCF